MDPNYLHNQWHSKVILSSNEIYTYSHCSHIRLTTDRNLDPMSSSREQMHRELHFILLIERLLRHIFYSNIFVMSENDLRVE